MIVAQTGDAGRYRAAVAVLLAALVVGLLLGPGAAVADPAAPDDRASFDPVVFVHGALGSASQFESHAMRFTSNGVPQELLFAFEYDTTRSGEEALAEDVDRLAGFVDEVLADTGADTVSLIGHSRGTGVAHAYLDDADRAAKVARYVNLDGRSAEQPPGGVPTLAVWAAPREDPDATDEREIVGARNVRLASQSHTQVATSAETFAEIYEHLTGQAPATVEVLPAAEVSVAGRAVVLGENRGPTDVGLELWEVAAGTGQRVGDEPVVAVELPEDGSFGPFDVEPGVRYEFAVVQAEVVHHHYLEPFERSNHFVRLLVSEPGSLVELVLPSDPEAAALTIQRNREWWGDQAGANDSLRVAGTELISPALFPRADWLIGTFVYDDGADATSNLDAPIGLFSLFPFITGIDLYLPASEDGSGTIEVRAIPRQADGRVIDLSVPDRPSEGHRTSLQFKDYLEVAADEPPPFTDVSPDSVHAEAIRELQLAGIVRGLDDERFAPGASIRRDQAASMLARALGLEPIDEGPFDDVTGNVHAGAINALAAAGLAEGSDGSFQPAASITRAQVASLLGRGLGLEPVAAGPFTDVPGDFVHAPMINALAAIDVVRGIDATTFAPGRDVQRDQFASMLARALEQVG